VSDSDSKDSSPTFEETFPRYEFAGLVRLCMLIGARIGGLRRIGRVGAWRSWLPLRREKRPAAPAS